jgi:transposase-like protein
MVISYQYCANWEWEIANSERNMIVEASKPVDRSRVRCKFCHGEEVVKNGLRKNIQYWLCKTCGHGFVDNQALPKMKYPVEIVAKAVDDFYKGASLLAICRDIGQATSNLPSISAVYGWIKKLTQSGLKEVKKHHPLVSDRWVVTVTSIWLNHNMYLYINMLDSETQFIIASRLGKFNDIKTVFESAREIANKCPFWIITDGWRGYGDVIEQVFGADAAHLVIYPFQSEDVSPDYLDYLQRWKKVFKTKYKLMRHPDENTQSVVDGMVLCYNYLTPHGNSGQKTPAEAARIIFPYKNWLDVAKGRLPLIDSIS